MVSTDGRTDRPTDGRTDGRTDTEGYNIIPRHTLVAGYKNEQTLSKMVFIIPNFLVLHFGENFMKIRTKIAKLQMHENLHRYVNGNLFSFTFLCKFC